MTTHGKPLARRLVGHDGRTLKERWEHEYVGLPHPRGHLRVRNPSQWLDDVEIGSERPEIAWQRTQKLEPPARAANSLPSFQQILDALALADSPSEQKCAGVSIALLDDRAKTPTIGGVGDYVQFFEWRALLHQALGDVVRRNKDPVGQRQVAQPALMEPGKKLAIERPAAEIHPHVLRRDRGFGLQHALFIANVAVDHAEDRRDAQPAAKGQSYFRTRRR